MLGARKRFWVRLSDCSMFAEPRRLLAELVMTVHGDAIGRDSAGGRLVSTHRDRRVWCWNIARVGLVGVLALRPALLGWTPPRRPRFWRSSRRGCAGGKLGSSRRPPHGGWWRCRSCRWVFPFNRRIGRVVAACCRSGGRPTMPPSMTSRPRRRVMPCGSVSCGLPGLLPVQGCRPLVPKTLLERPKVQRIAALLPVVCCPRWWRRRRSPPARRWCSTPRGGACGGRRRAVWRRWPFRWWSRWRHSPPQWSVCGCRA